MNSNDTLPSWHAAEPDCLLPSLEMGGALHNDPARQSAAAAMRAMRNRRITDAEARASAFAMQNRVNNAEAAARGRAMQNPYARWAQSDGSAAPHPTPEQEAAAEWHARRFRGAPAPSGPVMAQAELLSMRRPPRGAQAPSPAFTGRDALWLIAYGFVLGVSATVAWLLVMA